MRVAYFSPLNPQRSGIGDYSEELLPHLGEGAQITLFVDGFPLANNELASKFEVRDYRRKRSHLNDLASFDAVVYHMGNDHRYHSGIFDALMQHPGIVVLHDYALQDFFLGLARERGNPDLYLKEVEFAYGKELRSEAAEAFLRGAVPAIVNRPIDFPLNERIVKNAEAVIVHSEWARKRLHAFAPEIPIVHIPHLIHTEDPVQLSTNEVTQISSFGLITPGKGIELALRALSRLRHTHRFKYSLVGDPNSFFDVQQLIRLYQMDELVEVTGHVELDEFKERMRKTDIALNLRERTVGETSGCLCRLMSAGICSVVADVGWYGDLPDDCVVKVPLDSTTEALLVAYLERLIEDRHLRQRIGENARRYVTAKHAIEIVAESYLDFIRETVERRPRKELIASLSNDLAQLGVKSSDNAFLRSVAQDFSELILEPSNGHGASANHGARTNGTSNGRTPKVEGIDYKAAARSYLSNINEERRHHLRTKPFYNLAHKPEKYRNEGIDEDMHRHFCDFANMAVTLALAPGSRILDVGCGSGWLSEYFARLGYVVKGIDISPDLIQMSRERVERVPYGVDHETPLRCSFEVHDIESATLNEHFDAIICYDSLHHFEDEAAVMRNIAQMLPVGGMLFILEGDRPSTGSEGEHELFDVMNRYGTLESPFSYEYLRKILDDNGFAVVGDYASINGLFPRDSIVDNQLPLRSVSINQNYLACKKVTEGLSASTVRDSRAPGLLHAQIKLNKELPAIIKPGQRFVIELSITNDGDTLWLAGTETRLGTVMPASKLFNEEGAVVKEIHGEPPLSHSIAPAETFRLRMDYQAPLVVGRYKLMIDLVNQHVCWFEMVGSKPLVIEFEVMSDTL